MLSEFHAPRSVNSTVAEPNTRDLRATVHFKEVLQIICDMFHSAGTDEPNTGPGCSQDTGPRMFLPLRSQKWLF